MKAMILDASNDFLWTDVEKPTPSSKEVLIKVHNAGVNRADLLQKDGTYPSPEGCPPWCGLEVSGEVEKVGADCTRLKVGDRVCALLGGGGYSEYAAVSEGMCMKLPDGMTFEQGACIPEAYATAYLNLVHEADLKKGETIVIFAGASGVGIAATQIAKLMGARVVVTVRSDAKAEAIKNIGADRIVNTKKEDLGKVFEEESVNVVLDCVAGADLGKHFAQMARLGRWVMIATLAGVETTINLRALLGKRLKLIGSTLRSRTVDEKNAVMAELEKKVLPSIADGTVKPLVYARFPLENADKAQEVLRRNENVGKVILEAVK